MNLTKSMQLSAFKDKILLISGGTGSFGNAVLHRLITSELREIRIFSRDEKKQDDMRKRYNNDKIKFYLGDVRDFRSIEQAVRGVDFIFHAAALKQVPSCEFYPMQAVHTNILGTENLITAAISAKVNKVVCLSTDKAVYPINAMGISKAMMEKVIVAASRNINENETTICCTRYGNVMASRGSVIPLIVDQVLAKKPITITDPDMTRFMMTLEDAVDLVLYAFLNGKNGEIFVQKAPAASISCLSKAIIQLMGINEYPIQIIGTRHGEKLYEVLVSREEMYFAKDLGNYFSLPPDSRDLNYAKYYDEGSVIKNSRFNSQEYNSHNTIRLNIEEIKELLKKIGLLNYLKSGSGFIAEDYK